MSVELRAPWTLLVLLASLCGCCATAGAQSSTLYAAHTPARRATHSEARRARRTKLPDGRDIAALTFRECRRLLGRERVAFEAVPHDAAPRVYAPVYLLSPLSGVSFAAANGHSEHGMVDCRLAIALLAWAPVLREAGVVKVEHYSTYRPGARVARSSKISGHARAMAIDAARFHLADGRVLDVDSDWDERERHGEPCGKSRREDEAGALLRRVVCGAVERQLFQVVLTPHHDRAHQNHVHLELVPGVDWSYIH